MQNRSNKKVGEDTADPLSKNLYKHSAQSLKSIFNSRFGKGINDNGTGKLSKEIS